MSYLIDTNILSELRKGARCDPHVAAWSTAVPPEALFISVFAIGEIRYGIERARRRDQQKAGHLERWLEQVRIAFAGRTLAVEERIAEEWARLNIPDRLPYVDGVLAATAKVHGLTLATRNVSDLQRAGIPLVNPFAA